MLDFLLFIFLKKNPHRISLPFSKTVLSTLVYRIEFWVQVGGYKCVCQEWGCSYLGEITRSDHPSLTMVSIIWMYDNTV